MVVATPRRAAGAQRGLHRFVGNVVGSRDDQLAAGGVHQRLEHLGHGRVAHRGPGADHLGRQSRFGRRDRLPQQVVDIVVDVGHPVAGEQVLVLASDRPFESHHGIDPGRVLRLDQEFRVGAVLTAAIGDAVVDHDDLAVVAQIDAALAAAAAAGCRWAGPRPGGRPPRCMACQCSEAIMTREPSPSAMARQVTLRAAARFNASTILQPLLSGSQM